MHFEDDFALTSDGSIRAIGWLELGKSFSTGPIPSTTFERLAALISDFWDPVQTIGFHQCDLCQFTPEASGTGVLYVPSMSNIIYAAPVLLSHYVNAHHYRPPDAFLESVLACPPPRSSEYRRLLLSSGGPGTLQRIRNWQFQA